MRGTGTPDLIDRRPACRDVKSGKERLVGEQSQQGKHRRDVTPSTVEAVIAA
jgi:hypothetical protein